MHQHLSYLYAFFGLFLIGCGLLSVLVLGWKAKTALVSGGTFGLIALTAGHFLNLSQTWALYVGALEAVLLAGIFAWRASAAFLKLTELLQTHDTQAVRQKSIAFLIIATMFVTALVVLTITATFFADANNSLH
ncbi:hypothetical protein FVR03_10915 [Pontibacter qinzhouensis]|uniref:Uncharacterized protein n=1 Tax=Pontibacter qinzhouensis TaxID=2603253 RepID=A0A5C8K5T7_9BACT|nr:hypothetical protein [Pontibacter qinzhouensis]TXK46388.1 hypothetical protein FVR03_10915 [Pontibacter qinzhouensis]